MLRRITPYLLAIPLLINSCSGPSKLTQKSEEKLAGGDAWRAWQLATRALDKEPGNPRSRAAATAAGASIVEEWQRRIHALAETDSLKAAEQALDMAEFRENGARYATVPVGPGWPAEDMALRTTAARFHFQRGREAFDSARPKKAYAEFTDAERFVSDYRDVAKRADRALGQAITNVAVVPFRARSSEPSFGVQVAQAWRENLVQELAPPTARFTRVLAGDAIERTMTLSELEDVSREEAIRLGREMGANRVVWGSVGPVKSSTRLNLFRDTVCRRVMSKDATGHESPQWVDVPIEVVARVRDVTIGVDYEVIAIKGGATLARRHVDRSTSARVVWTSYQPEGDPSSYSLVSETMRSQNPNRARDVESRWKSVCGDATTLVQVLEARRATKSSGQYGRDVLPRFVAGAAFVFLEDLPPAEDLALATLAHGAAPLREDLLRLDEIDDVDLYVDRPDTGGR